MYTEHRFPCSICMITDRNVVTASVTKCKQLLLHNDICQKNMNMVMSEFISPFTFSVTAILFLCLFVHMYSP